MGIHDGHRERMRERFEQFGGNGFTDHELLEMLLYYEIQTRKPMRYLMSSEALLHGYLILILRAL